MLVFFCDFRRVSKSFGVRFLGRFAMEFNQGIRCNNIFECMADCNSYVVFIYTCTAKILSVWLCTPPSVRKL